MQRRKSTLSFNLQILVLFSFFPSEARNSGTIGNTNPVNPCPSATPSTPKCCQGINARASSSLGCSGIKNPEKFVRIYSSVSIQMSSNPKSLFETASHHPIPILPAVHPQHPFNPNHFHGDRKNNSNCSSHRVEKKYPKAQPSFSGPGVCLLVWWDCLGRSALFPLLS